MVASRCVRSVHACRGAGSHAIPRERRKTSALACDLRDVFLCHAWEDRSGQLKSCMIYSSRAASRSGSARRTSSSGLIIRRDNKLAHAVNQVSTGQRAALALSIFLALNDRAKSAPPIILIDDSVAHVDDLNTLSFLDYLRELGLRRRKQLFFATTDIRLAALFQRKI